MMTLARQKIQQLILLLPLVALLPGCNESEHVIPQGTPISFTTPDNWASMTEIPQTKAGHYTINTTYQKSTNKDFAITAFYLPKGTDDVSNLAPNFMYQQQIVHKGENNYTYSPIKYWPTMTEDKLQFFAFWPYKDDSRIRYNGTNSTVGYPTLTYNSPEANIDVLGANIKTSKSELEEKGYKKVPLHFKHLLTKVNFKFKQENFEEKDFHPLVYRVSFNAPTVGTYTFDGSGDFTSDNQATNPLPGQWSSLSEYKDIIRYTDSEGEVIYQGDAKLIEHFTCYVLPGTVLQEFDIIINSENVHYKHGEGITLGQGKEVTLTFTIEDKGTNLFMTTYTIVWDSGETIEGTLI